MPIPERPAVEYSNLRPYYTLPDITKPGWDCEPLVMHRVGERGQHLVFVAVRHSTSAEKDSPHYRAARAGLDLFVELTNGEPAVTVVEGGLRTPSATAEESYALSGEGAMAAFYAGQHGFEQVCFEPPGQGRKQVLAQRFSNEEFDAYLLGRFVPSYWLRGRTKSFDDFMRDRLTGSGDLAFDWGGPAPTYEYLVANWEDMYGTPFTPDDPQTLQFLLEETHGYMLPPRSRPHEACIATNHIRDNELARGTYEKFVIDGVHTAVVHSLPHGQTLQPFIESLGPPYQGAAGRTS